MNKRVQNLERLLQKLQFRYGSDDDLVVQLKHELGASGVQEFKNPVMNNRIQRQHAREETLNASAPGRREHDPAAQAQSGI